MVFDALTVSSVASKRGLASQHIASPLLGVPANVWARKIPRAPEGRPNSNLRIKSLDSSATGEQLSLNPILKAATGRPSQSANSNQICWAIFLRNWRISINTITGEIGRQASSDFLCENVQALTNPSAVRSGSSSQ